MERSEIWFRPGRYDAAILLARSIPDFAALNPGNACSVAFSV
jgi:hypothetical protein